jgi:quinohemoprotein ethanol dehydrogenase
VRNIFYAWLGFLLTQSAAFLASAGEQSAGVNWENHDGGQDQASYSSLHEIDKSTVARLGLAWSLDLPGEQTLEATPLAVDGTLYFTGSASTVYAVNAQSGRLLWRYDPEIYKYMPSHMKYIFGVNRGAAYWNGEVFVGTIDGRLIALDAKSGKLLWSQTTVTAESVQTITGAPLIAGGRVLIGSGGADFKARGYVTAYDAKTGKQLWRFYTVPGNPNEGPQSEAMKRAAKTWGGEWWKVGGGGGTVWDGMTYDPELKLVYIGVGNSGPYDPRIRSPGGGDNLYLASIVALDADTGGYRWHYQVNPREAWDFKATAGMVSATLNIAGRNRKVLMQSPTNGFFYVLDRETGELLSAEKTGKVTWADHIDMKTGRPVEAANIRYETGQSTFWPSPFGTHNWQSMAYSPKSGLVYIPYMQLGAVFTYTAPAAANSKRAGPLATVGGLSIAPVLADAEDGKGALLAWDPVAQKARWKIPLPYLWNGGTLATAGGLVFQGDALGQLSAYDAVEGRALWHFDAKLGIIASPMTYQVGGHQFVSILVGYGGATATWSKIMYRGWKFGLQPRRLLTFSLDGRAALPLTPPPDTTVHAVDDPQLNLNEAQVSAGEALYAANCMMCHGGNLVSAGAPAPDLRESVAARDLGAIKVIVQGGSLAPLGMPRFDDFSDEKLQDLYMYIRAGAREALGLRQPPGKASEGNRF